MPTAARVLLGASLLHSCASFLPAQNPPWAAAWGMRSSTLAMVCNSSGYTNATFAAQLGVASFDWSQSKTQWAADKPMTCEEHLATQAQMVHDAGAAKPGGRVFSYFNLVKALVGGRSRERGPPPPAPRRPSPLTSRACRSRGTGA